MKSWAWATLHASVTSRRFSSSGSAAMAVPESPSATFWKTEPLKGVGSCCTSRTLVRSHCRFRPSMGRQSRVTLPPATEYQRSRMARTVLLPEPLGPTRAVVRPAGTSRSRPPRTTASGHDG